MLLRKPLDSKSTKPAPRIIDAGAFLRPELRQSPSIPQGTPIFVPPVSFIAPRSANNGGVQYWRYRSLSVAYYGRKRDSPLWTSGRS
jgi:hypothetical protein